MTSAHPPPQHPAQHVQTGWQHGLSMLQQQLQQQLSRRTVQTFAPDTNQPQPPLTPHPSPLHHSAPPHPHSGGDVLQLLTLAQPQAHGTVAGQVARAGCMGDKVSDGSEARRVGELVITDR